MFPLNRMQVFWGRTLPCMFTAVSPVPKTVPNTK